MFVAWVWGRGETGHNRPPKSTLRVSMFLAWVWGRGESGHHRPPKITLRVSMFIAWVWGRGETGHNRPPKITLRVSMFIAWVWGRGKYGEYRRNKRSHFRGSTSSISHWMKNGHVYFASPVKTVHSWGVFNPTCKNTKSWNILKTSQIYC